MLRSILHKIPELLLIILADGPTSALDVTIQTQIITLFKDLHRKAGFASFFITHDLALVEDLCDTIHVMDNGAIGETLTRGNTLRKPGTRQPLWMAQAACALSETALGNQNLIPDRHQIG